PLRGRRCDRPGPRTLGHCFGGKAVRGPPRAESQKTCLPSRQTDAPAAGIQAASHHVRKRGRLPGSSDGAIPLPGPAERTVLMFPSSGRRRAFTLIELLVVIAIIAVLIGLLV